MRSTIRSLESLRFADGYSSGRLKRKIATAGAVLFALLSGNPLAAASQSSASFSPATMPAIAAVDDRFESYNVEMAEVIGGKFWKPYDSATLASLRTNAAAPQTGSSASFVIGQDPTMFPETLESPSVKLNGQTLHLGRNDELPALGGAAVKAGSSTLQPASITFLTFATANNTNCH